MQKKSSGENQVEQSTQKKFRISTIQQKHSSEQQNKELQKISVSQKPTSYLHKSSLQKADNKQNSDKMSQQNKQQKVLFKQKPVLTLKSSLKKNNEVQQQSHHQQENQLQNQISRLSRYDNNDSNSQNTSKIIQNNSIQKPPSGKSINRKGTAVENSSNMLRSTRNGFNQEPVLSEQEIRIVQKTNKSSRNIARKSKDSSSNNLQIDQQEATKSKTKGENKQYPMKRPSSRYKPTQQTLENSVQQQQLQNSTNSNFRIRKTNNNNNVNQSGSRVFDQQQQQQIAQEVDSLQEKRDKVNLQLQKIKQEEQERIQREKERIQKELENQKKKQELEEQEQKRKRELELKQFQEKQKREKMELERQERQQQEREQQEERIKQMKEQQAWQQKMIEQRRKEKEKQEEEEEERKNLIKQQQNRPSLRGRNNDNEYQDEQEEERKFDSTNQLNQRGSQSLHPPVRQPHRIIVNITSNRNRQQVSPTSNGQRQRQFDNFRRRAQDDESEEEEEEKKVSDSEEEEKEERKNNRHEDSERQREQSQQTEESEAQRRERLRNDPQFQSRLQSLMREGLRNVMEFEALQGIRSRSQNPFRIQDNQDSQQGNSSDNNVPRRLQISIRANRGDGEERSGLQFGLGDRLSLGRQGQRVVNLSNLATNLQDIHSILLHISLLQSLLPQQRPGLTQDQINQFPIIEYKYSENDSCCSICLEEFEVKEKIKALTCLHKFHPSCIDDWLKTKPTCPNCKADQKLFFQNDA